MSDYRERRLLSSISSGWAGKRNFSNFEQDEISLFFILQAGGKAYIAVDGDGTRWARLTGAGENRLCELNINATSTFFSRH